MEISLNIKRKEIMTLVGTVLGIDPDEADANIVNRVIDESQTVFNYSGYTAVGKPKLERMGDRVARVELKVYRLLDTPDRAGTGG